MRYNIYVYIYIYIYIPPVITPKQLFTSVSVDSAKVLNIPLVRFYNPSSRILFIVRLSTGPYVR